VIASNCSIVYNLLENGGELVLISAFMTLAVTIGLTMYAYSTKTDFTVMGSKV
jgi:hypothetical protein